MALLVAAALLPLAAPARAANSDTVTDEVLVGIRSTTRDTRDFESYAAATGRIAGSHAGLRALRIKLNGGQTLEGALARLRRHADVAYAEPNHILRKLATPNDTYYANGQWGPQRVQADAAWGIWQPHAEVVLAIVDTGIDYTHPDLQQVLLRDSGGNVVAHNSLNSAASADDDEGHGSHCAGIAAAQINNSAGIAGIAGWNPAVANSNTYVKLMPVKVLDRNGSGTDASVADGITWAADHGAQVISMSLGGSSTSSTLSNAVKYALNKGVVVVAAAGNDGTSGYSYPGAYSGVISVAATDGDDRLASFSNYGSWVKVAAPGVDILSSYAGGGYQYLSGTSMATPLVAGEAAAIRAQAPSLTNTQVASLITGNVESYLPYRTGGGIAVGAGRVNVYKALQAAGGGTGGGTGDEPAVLISVSLASAVTASGSNVTGTVRLDGPAPAGGISVSLSSDNAAASVPASVTVYGGGTSATFNLHANNVSAATKVTLTATLDSVSKTTAITVNGVGVALLTLTRASLQGGASTNGTVYLSGNAPPGGITVSLSSADSAVTVPSTVMVASNAASALFTVTSAAVQSDTSVTLTAGLNGTSATAVLTVKAVPPPTLSGLTIGSTAVKGGKTLNGKVTLSGPATGEGALVTLRSSKGKVLQVPASVLVPAGATTVNFSVTTKKVGAKNSVVVTATYGEGTRKVTVQVKP